jgi:iron complex outermembrane recepter protein
MKNRSLRARRFLPVLTLIALSDSAVAQSEVPEIQITAYRTPQHLELQPQGVDVITAKEIKSSGATTVRDAIRWLAGVVTRTDTSTGREPVLDLRGFGETSASNTVILIDGVRQNEGDMNGTTLSWIPIDGIERIEILRGSGAVLYGEGATAGVINIITNKSAGAPSSFASLTLGSFGTQDARLGLNTTSGPWRFQVHANSFESDNHRNSYETKQRNALVRATWAEADATWSVQLGGQTSRSHQPGGLTPADFETRPDFAYKTADQNRSDTGNLLLSAELPLGTWRMGMDVNHRVMQQDADLQSSSYVSDTKTTATRAGLRMWNTFSLDEQRHRFLVGLDSEQWEQQDVNTYGSTHIEQKSNALYARHEIEFSNQGIKVFGGVRRTESLRESSGSAVGSLDQPNTSWEMGAAKRVGEKAEIFARSGTSFRLPNANEFSCFDGAFCPVNTANLLRPQTSRDLEFGYRRNFLDGRWAVRYYRHDLANEIAYVPSQFANINFDPTRRDGFEFDVNARLGKTVDAGLQYALRRAIFRDGVNAGRDIPLVPSQTLTARLVYAMSSTQHWQVTTQLVSSQRIGDDFSNTSLLRIPGYGVTNLRYSQKLNQWTLSAEIRNIGDRAYYNYRTRVSAVSRSVYPEPGRAFYLTARHDF